MPAAQGSLQEVCSSRPRSYNFTSANGSLHRLRMCRLRRLHSTISPLIGCKLFCSGTLEHDCSARGLGAKLPRAAFGWSFGLKQMTHWNYPSLLLQDFRRKGSLAFIFVCLFIHVFKRGRYFSSHEKPVPSRTETSLKRCWQALGISLTLPKHRRLSWQ